MNQINTRSEAAGGVGNPIDSTGLCLLSLDGGGVRGLSTLHVLKVIMDRLNHERAASGLDCVKPCDVFDMIGGTSTGGLIAIMLGRLEMDVDECITAYNELSADVFANPQRRLPFGIFGKLAPRFDSAQLKEAILKIIAGRGLPPNADFNDGQDRGCKTFVCATSKDLYGIQRLQSYSANGKPSLACTIVQAALATSAASGFFDAVQIDARRFVDGALGANNPVEQVEDEASDIWCRESRDLKPLVKCFVSIGTGNPGKKPIEDRFDKFISKTLVGIATETEKTAAQFIKRWRQHYDNNRFFRFNVEQGLQTVGLAEHEKRGVMETATEQYMCEAAQESRVRDCVQNLKMKQNRSGINLVSVVEKFQNIRVPRQHFMVPFPRDADFVQRETIWKRTTDQFTGPAQRIAFVGMGGVGKSQLSIEFAYTIYDSSRDTSVFWVHGNSKVTFEESYRAIADVLDLPRRHEPEVNVLGLVRDWLQRSDILPWLMILDNADDVSVFFPEKIDNSMQLLLASYLPKAASGKILVTSRSLDAAERLTGGGKAVLQIPVMEEQQALALLRTKLEGEEDEHTAIDLVRALDRVPLAITQAAAYINRRGPRLTIRSYLDKFHQNEQKKDSLLRSDKGDLGRDDGVSNSVVVTWQVTFEQIKRDRPNAAKLLSLMSCFQAQNIPESMLHGYDVGTAIEDHADSDEDSDNKAGPEDLEDDLDVLRGYSLVTLTTTGLCEMHSLVQFCTRMWTKKFGDSRLWDRLFMRLAAEHFPSGAFETWEECRRLLPHIERLVTGTRREEGDLRSRSQLLTSMSWYMLTIGEHSRAERLAEEAVLIRQEDVGADHPSTLSSMNNLASTYRSQGRWMEAEKLQVEVLETRKTKLGADHPDTLSSMNNLASTYRSQGRWMEAEKLQVEVMETFKTKLGPDHPNTLTNMNNLAFTWHEQGRTEDALALMQDCVCLQVKRLGSSHPDTTASKAALASWKAS